MAIRDLATIIGDAIDFITTARPNIATFTGSVIRDVVIESPAQEFATLNEELERTQKLQSVSFPDNQTEEELEALAANYGLTRLGGKQATGTITFQIRNFSGTSATVSIPAGTVVGTVGTDTLPQAIFVTTEALIFQPSLAASYFNPTTGLYEQTADIVAGDVGTAGNVSAATITVLISAISGIDSVTNTVATTGGEDVESNEDLASRIQTKLAGNNIGTTTGIINLMRENANVTDAIVVTPNDSEMIRDEFGGEVDVYILGANFAPTTDIFLYETTGSQEFVLFHQPAISVSSVTGIAGGTPTTFIQGTDYNFVLDPSTLIGGSVRVEHKIQFNIGGTNPDDATNITVNYTYNQLIETLQLELDQDDQNIVTSDILVKEATEATIDITADVTLFPGFTQADAIADIQTIVSTNIDNLGLGDSIDRSDVVEWIEQSESVDAVNLSTLILEKDTVVLPSADQRLQIFKTEYPRAGTIAINIV